MNEKKILEFFKRSYGDSYYGDKEYKARYLRFMTDLVEVKNAKSLLVNKRIFSVGTDPDCDRMQAMITLLTKTKLTYPESWISIESKFKSMKHAAIQVGMERLQDEKLINKLLVESDTGEKYVITTNRHGLVIFRSNKKDYFQEIYQ